MMKYNIGTGSLENWIVGEEKFSAKTLGKCEAIMYLGNGYMGLRSATEEPYLGETRNLFVSGTFNKFDENEVTELPNVADVTRLDITVDGDRFSLEFGETKEYLRQLNLKTAELTRTVTWVSPKGKELQFTFRRFISLKNLHVIASHVEITAVNDSADVTILSGINAQLSNSGAQHFSEGNRRIYDKKFIQLIQTTTESNIDIVLNTVHNVRVNETDVTDNALMRMDRRKVWLDFTNKIEKGSTLVFEKLTNVYTSRDKEWTTKEYSLEALCEVSLAALRQEAQLGYEALLQENITEWNEKVWSKYNFHIESEKNYDLLALRFAIFHLTIMTPAHDSRMGVGAKALSGEGYKGHSFWDTEVFILPFFTYTNPEVARQLLKYRYRGLAGAHKKAQENGYNGAMYPWEAAWPTDGEVTPVWGAVDVVSGKQTKIWSGFIEQHITADIAYAVWQYYKITGDEQFMLEHGYEMLLDTAKFWASRLEWNEEKKEYHINNVIGPDEYKEHVNNNAFTNYMAHFNIELAMEYTAKLKENNADVYATLNEKLDLEAAYREWEEKIGLIYLPTPREEDNLIPQDDTYLQKEIIDLTKYKNQTKVGSLFEDYSLDQVNEIQVSKQADMMILFYMLENKFTNDVKIANYNYYEPKTLHDSSLSLSTHCILANDLGDKELAYELFSRAAEIDLGPAMNTSDHGVHAASIGGIWQCVVMGFAGVRMMGGNLRMNPSLPENWNKLSFTIEWQQQPLNVEVTENELHIEATEGKEVTLEVFGQSYTFTDKLNVQLNKEVATV